MNNTFEIEKPTLRDVFYHRARLQSNIYYDVLERFAALAKETGFTKKQLAESIGKDAAQITRLFAEPGNWTLATVSDLLIGMGVQLEHSAVSIRPQESNYIEIATTQPPVTFTGASNANWNVKTVPTYSYANQA